MTTSFMNAVAKRVGGKLFLRRKLPAGWRIALPVVVLGGKSL